ncbi:MAG: ribosome maturation factor RimP [Acidimicrobiia bacterium]|nr:ribosome maturation factor RimP [Acidimicrobiia bacterium]
MLARVRELAAPVASDLGLEIYDVEHRGGTLRVTLDTPAGSASGVTLDRLALASRLVSRELDEHDPVPGRYTLEVTSPGVERSLRTPAHFQREVGKVVAVRLADVGHEERRITGTLVAADERTATFSVDGPDGPVERVIALEQIDRARTVFVWAASPKPTGARDGGRKRGARPARETACETKEHSS